MQGVIVIGAGGHAKVVLDILIQSRDFEVVGLVSKDGSPAAVLGVPVIGSDDRLCEIYRRGTKCAFVAVGENRVRMKLIREVTMQGFQLINAISRNAVISSDARLGLGIAAMPGAVVNAGSVIHDGVILNTSCSVDHDCNLGTCAHIGPGCHLAGNVLVGTGAFMGTGSCAIPGVSIGAWSTVGAGAAVVKDIPPDVIATGVPAKARKVLSERM